MEHSLPIELPWFVSSGSKLPREPVRPAAQRLPSSTYPLSDDRPAGNSAPSDLAVGSPCRGGQFEVTWSLCSREFHPREGSHSPALASLIEYAGDVASLKDGSGSER